MTKQEIITKIMELENRIFMIDMIDTWQPEDRELYNKLSKELLALQKQLKEIDNPKPKPQN